MDGCGGYNNSPPSASGASWGSCAVVRDGTYDSSGTIGGQSYTITDFVVPVYGALPLGTRVRVVPIEEKT